MKKCYFLRLLFVLCCSLYSSLLLGQKKGMEIDSLATYSYRQLGDRFYASQSDSAKAIAYASAYIKKSQSMKDTLNMATGYFLLSDITKNSKHFVNYWNNIIDSLKDKENKRFPAISYLELGDFYYNRGEYSLALRNYINSERSTQRNYNDSLMFIVTHRMGLIKAANGDKKTAIKLFKKVYDYYNSKSSKENSSYDFYSLSLNLSSLYLQDKKYDSAKYFNNKAINLIAIIKDSSMLGYPTFFNGKIEYLNKNYNKAIIELKKSIPFLKLDQNITSISNCFYYLQKSFLEIGDKKTALSYALKIDSLFQKHKYFYSSQKPAYKSLIEYYRKQNNNQKELEYINKYLAVDSVLTARAIKVNKNLTDNYDIPKLLEERKVLLGKLEHKLSNSKQWLIGLGTGSLFLIFILVSQARKKKMYQQRFLELLNKEKDSQNHMEESAIQYETNLPEDVVADILTRLELFENKQDFLSNKITLPNLAKTFHTNSNYLSKVINHHKKQSYSNYINKLRINYAVERLKTDMVFRKYTLKAIGEEIGFKNTDSFTNAFYKFTGIKASYFITELDNH